MPNHKSAIKRVRQNKRRNERNTHVRADARTTVKKVRDAILAGDKEKASALLILATSALHSASTKGVLHANNASRRISRLAKQVNKI